MHKSAMLNAKFFFDTYTPPDRPLRIVEIGSQDVNGSIRQFAPASAEYIGVDFVNGKGVDVILKDPYSLPFETGSVDVVLSSSCFEHSELFWLLFNEIMRILKPAGLFYLNVPSNGEFHRYPVDCWRFYPDSGNALVTWAKRSGFDAALLESFTTYQDEDIWNDFVAVFLRDRCTINQHPDRIIPKIKNYTNGLVFGGDSFLNIKAKPEDQMKLKVISMVLDGSLR